MGSLIRAVPDGKRKPKPLDYRVIERDGATVVQQWRPRADVPNRYHWVDVWAARKRVGHGVASGESTAPAASTRSVPADSARRCGLS